MHRSRRPTLACALLLAACLLTSGCSGSQRSPSGTGATTSSIGATAGSAPNSVSPRPGLTVTESNAAFGPPIVTITKGETVMWRNADSTPHHIKFDNGTDLGVQQPGDIVKWTGNETGSFRYSCLIHPTMRGEVIVK